MPATANSNSMDSRRDTRMDAAKNGSRRILQATRINRIHPVAPGPRRRWPLIMSTPLPGSARVTDALLTERKRSEEHTSELQSLLRSSYAVLCLKNKKKHTQII